MQFSKLLSVFAVVSTMALIGCEQKAADTAKPAEGGSVAAAPAAAPAGDSIGIPECDEYLAKMAKCLDKLPDAAKGGVKQALDANRDAWKQSAAAGPEAKAALAGGCKTALDSSKQAYQAMGCEF